MPKLKSSGMRGSPCSPPLCLMNLVPGPGASFPHVRGGAGVHGSYKGQQPLQTGHAVQLLQEAAPQHVVICPHAVNGKHCTLRICVGERPDRVSDAISARPCGEGELIWCTQRPSRIDEPMSSQPASGTTCRWHTTILFLQGCHGRTHKGAARKSKWDVSASSKHSLSISYVHLFRPCVDKAVFYLGQSYLGQFLLRPVLLKPCST